MRVNSRVQILELAIPLSLDEFLTNLGARLFHRRLILWGTPFALLCWAPGLCDLCAVICGLHRPRGLCKSGNGSRPGNEDSNQIAFHLISTFDVWIGTQTLN